jgi:hypothetical protein
MWRGAVSIFPKAKLILDDCDSHADREKNGQHENDDATSDRSYTVEQNLKDGQKSTG